MNIPDIGGAAAPVDALTRAGVTAHGRRTLVADGTLVHHGRGLYSHALAPDADAFARSRAAHLAHARSYLATRQDAYLVGESALIAWNLPLLDEPSSVHVSSRPSARVRRPGIEAHRPWRHDILVTRDGVRVQAPAAAVVETGARRGALAGLVPADRAAAVGMLTDVDTAVRAWGTRGGVGFARTMAAFVDGRRESPLETRAAWEAHLAGVTLVPQVVIRDEHGGWVARGDFVVDGRNVLVEVDGIGKYRRHADLKNERVRHNQIEELGWIVVRVTDECLRFGRFIPRLRDAVARSSVRITP